MKDQLIIENIAKTLLMRLAPKEIISMTEMKELIPTLDKYLFSQLANGELTVAQIKAR